ncbi:MAG: sigma-70 family RNA polymerase sigma factor [Planctomycetes bacterium]|nr:sigma-70 family RNA polymerase sigma factor [Planctomycetota bacterium]
MDALRRIYEKYKLDLLSVAGALLNCPTAVEDVLHDVFVGFASQAGRFRLKGSLKGYLAICTANRARNFNRRDRQNSNGPLVEGKSTQQEQMSPAEVTGRKEQHKIVSCALAQLPQDQRQVIVLHILGSLRFREIAHQSGESINTIQSRYRYGLVKLQSLLNGEVE